MKINREGNDGQWSPIFTYEGHRSSVNTVQFAPAEFGLVLACGSTDGDVSILTGDPQVSPSDLSKLSSFNPYWQISGKFLRPFYWKTHLLKIMSTIQFFSILGRHTDRFTGKLIQLSIA